MPAEDPGWPVSWRTLLWLFIPGLGIHRQRQRANVAGAVSTVVGQRFERPLSCEDDAKLAESYRKRFFLRLASSEVAALLGFVGFFLTYAWWPYPIGAAITAMGFRRAAPTSTRLARDQEELTCQGCQRSLTAALRHAATRQVRIEEQ